MTWFDFFRPSAALLMAFCLLIIGLSTAHAESRLHHALTLSLDPAAGRLDAIDVIEVNGRQRLALKLADGLAVETITVDGETVDASMENGVAWIALPSEGNHRIEITYGGVMEAQDPARGLSAMVAESGVFLPYGIGWLASAGAEDDRATYVLTLDVPAPYKAVATGSLVEEKEEDGRYLATFEATRPTEPPSVFAGVYEIEERQHGELRLRTYFPAEQQQLAATYFERSALYIDRYEEIIGDYPYDGFSVIASPLPVGLGFPGSTYISSQILGMPFMLGRSLAHEILHNWWANGVFLDASQGNWAEGLTTYMADYGLAEDEGEDAAWQMRLGWLRDFAALPAERDRPVSSFRSKGHDADQVVGYNKVAMIFHMLRHELGDETFTAGLRDFWESHRFKSASWSDLQASFETANDEPLDRFFDPWLGRTGAPALSLDRAEVEESEGGHRLTLALSSDSAEYDLLVPVQIETPEDIEKRTVRLENGVAEATFDLTARPLGIGIDQRHNLFRRLAEGEAPPILRDVTLASDALTVIAVNGSEEAKDVARSLAQRTLDTGLRLAAIDDPAIREVPLLLIGLRADIGNALSTAGITPPAALPEDGTTARSWVTTRDGAPPALVVEAEDDAALSALLRPLPHYGRQSFLAFKGGKVIEKGIWPTGDNALTRRFE